MSDDVLRMYTIYEHPRDYPEGFVVREWEIGPGTMTPGKAWRAASLKGARAWLPPGLSQLPRFEGDDPVIVETWM